MPPNTSHSLSPQLSGLNASRFARRKGSRQRHPGDGKSDSGNNRAGLEVALLMTPSDFGFFSVSTLLGSAARGKRGKSDNLSVAVLCTITDARTEQRLIADWHTETVPRL